DQLLLVFSDLDCGPCDALAPELAALERATRGKGLRLLLVGRGAAEANGHKKHEHGIEFPVVVQERWKLSKQFGIFTTPVAFLIGPTGRIESDVAIGREQILALAQSGLQEGKEADRVGVV